MFSRFENYQNKTAPQYSEDMYEAITGARSKYVFSLQVVFAWTLFGIFFGTQSYIRATRSGTGAALSRYLISWLICGYSWALLTAPILWFRNRFSLGRLGWSRFLLVHIPAAVVFGLAQLGVYVLISGSLFGTRNGYWDFYKHVVVSEIQFSFLVYLAIVLAASAYDRFTRQPIPEESVSDPIRHNSDPLPQTKVEANGWLRRLSIKERGTITLVDTTSIDLITTYGNYLFIQTAEKRHIYRETMAAMEKQLDPTMFVRISRAAMVNVERIKELRVMGNGEFEVVLKNGSRLNSTRRYRKHLETVLNSK